MFLIILDQVRMHHLHYTRFPIVQCSIHGAIGSTAYFTWCDSVVFNKKKFNNVQKFGLHLDLLDLQTDASHAIESLVTKFM